MVNLGQKLKMQKYAKNHNSTRTLELFCEKTARKNTKYSRNETILKIGHLAKAIAFVSCQFGSRIKNVKHMRKTIVREHKSCSVQKAARTKHQIIEK